MTTKMMQLAAVAGEALKKFHLTVATAESCTGGGLSFWLTAIPGSSAWFECGFVTYSNLSKIQMLGVKPETIEHFGAVSEQTAIEMAKGAIAHSDADWSLAITGIAGPDGGTVDKPVGTVWIALSKDKGQSTDFVAKVFTGNREDIRLQSMEYALEMLVTALKD